MNNQNNISSNLFLKPNYGLKAILFLLGYLFLVATLYSYILWYMPTMLTSIFCILFFSYLTGKFINYSFKSILSDSNNIKYIKFLSLLFLIIITLISWWLYWVFAIDLYLNQTSWVKIDISFLPFEYIRYTKTDMSNVFYLLTHPSKVYSYLEVKDENKAFFKEDQILIWLEIILSLEISRGVIWKKYPLTQFSPYLFKTFFS